jgi:UDP-GlcNAc:undecaprenyl-phosphate GlcNAc-1-phosphate transferase
MYTILTLSIIPLLVALFIAYFVTPLVIKFAKFIGAVDDPNINKHPKVIHTYPVPRAGGLAAFIALAVTSLIFLPPDKYLLSILLGGAIIALIGTLDDKYNLNPYIRLLSQFLIAGVPIAAGIGVTFVNLPFTGIIDFASLKTGIFILDGTFTTTFYSSIFTLFWIVFLMNMLNMGAKGVDGQLPGVVAIASITIALLSLKYSADITQWPVIVLASIVAGAYIGFLPWNFYPQKIMPSFTGSTLAGFMLAILSILSTTKVGTLMVVLAVPLIDTGYAVIRRLIKGKSPVWGDRGHFHHKLLDAGWSKTKVALFYWAITAVMGILAINLNASYKLYTMIGAAVLMSGLILWLTYRKSIKN